MTEKKGDRRRKSERNGRQESQWIRGIEEARGARETAAGHARSVDQAWSFIAEYTAHAGENDSGRTWKREKEREGERNSRDRKRQKGMETHAGEKEIQRVEWKQGRRKHFREVTGVRKRREEIQRHERGRKKSERSDDLLPRGPCAGYSDIPALLLLLFLFVLLTDYCEFPSV